MSEKELKKEEVTLSEKELQEEVTRPAHAPSPSVSDLAKRTHPAKSIFRTYPSYGAATLRAGSIVTVPYHNYDGDALIAWGSADAKWVANALQGPWVPLLDQRGRAQMAVWMVHYKDTCLNPYKEFIIVFSVVHEDRQEGVPVVRYPHQQLQLFEDKKANPYIYKLWLDETLPVDYGRELLGCDKYYEPGMKLEFNPKAKTVDFECSHATDERNPGEATGLMIRGKLALAEEGHLSSLVGAFGLGRTLGMASGVSGSWHVVNPAGVMARPDTERFNPVWGFLFETSPKFTTAKKEDEIEYGGELKAMDFTASLYQHDPHIRAVLLPAHSFTPVQAK